MVRMEETEKIEYKNFPIKTKKANDDGERNESLLLSFLSIWLLLYV